MKKYLLLVVLFHGSVFAAGTDCYEKIKAEEESQGLSDLDNKIPVFGTLEPRDTLPMCADVERIYREVQMNIYIRYVAECGGVKTVPNFENPITYTSTTALLPITNITVWNKTKNGYRNFTAKELGDDLMLLFDEIYVPSSVILKFSKAPLGFIRPCWTKLISTNARSLMKDSSLGIVTYSDQNKVGALSDYLFAVRMCDENEIRWKKLNELDTAEMNLVSTVGEPVEIQNIKIENFGVDQLNLPTEEQIKAYNFVVEQGALFVGYPENRILVSGLK